MEINFDSAAAVPIINVPAKKVSPQGTSLTREMNGLPLIRYSMVYTHTSWSLRKSPLPQNALQAIFPMKYGPISGNLAASYDTFKNLSIFHESVSIMNTLDKST